MKCIDNSGSEAMKVEKREIELNELKVIEGLDVEQGILYCNGDDTYLEILRAFCEDWEESGKQIEDLFQKKDWKNYTVAVHGLKSALFSIGVNKISEMAKQLEFAGKENRITYIEENHAKLIENYKSFFVKLTEIDWLCTSKEEVDEEDEVAESLSGNEFDKVISEMEMAAYSFDIDTLEKRLEELEKYSYNGNNLKNSLIPVRRKIEMADYISAVELLANRKREMD